MRDLSRCDGTGHAPKALRGQFMGDFLNSHPCMSAPSNFCNQRSISTSIFDVPTVLPLKRPPNSASRQSNACRPVQGNASGQTSPATKTLEVQDRMLPDTAHLIAASPTHDKSMRSDTRGRARCTENQIEELAYPLYAANGHQDGRASHWVLGSARQQIRSATTSARVAS
jgi:hypothetical protein